MSDYINYKMQSNYNEFLIKELIKSFNNSYNEFIFNLISGDIEENAKIFISSKIDTNLEYIKEKVQKETGYYSLLLNNTKKLGITSKRALISLYDYIFERANRTLQY